MKRVLLLGIILAIFILAMPQGVLALDKTAIVNAEFVGVTLDFQVTNPVATWTLNRGDNY